MIASERVKTVCFEAKDEFLQYALLLYPVAISYLAVSLALCFNFQLCVRRRLKHFWHHNSVTKVKNLFKLPTSITPIPTDTENL